MNFVEFINSTQICRPLLKSQNILRESASDTKTWIDIFKVIVFKN